MNILRKIKKVVKAINIKNIKAVLNYIKRNGFKGLYSTCVNHIRFGKMILDEYATWIANNEPSKEQLEEQKNYISCQDLQFQILALEPSKTLCKSIEEQTYSKVTTNVSDKKEYSKIITNSKSDYIVFTYGQISLAPFAICEIAKSIEYRDSIMIYSDNDKLIDNERKEPHFKPNFAKDTLISQNYIGNLLVVKTNFLKKHIEIVENLGKQIIYDIAFRVSEKTRKIEHIQKILYHELQEHMEIDIEDEKEIIKKHLERTGIQFKTIQDGKFLGQYHVEYKIEGEPKVSIVIPNKDHIEDLDKCLQSIFKSTYSNYEIVIVENNSEDEETFNYYSEMEKKNSKVKVVKYNINYFNYSAIVNFGVYNSSGEYVILLNNDIEIITEDWIEQMLMYTQRKDVGICGAKLYFSDRTIQHAGVTIGTRGLAGHRFREMKESEYHERDYINIVQDLSAVTAACFMVRKQLYDELLGFDEKLAVAFNDVDFCLKIREAKYLIVYNPFVEAYHYESKSRGVDTSGEKEKRFSREYELFVKRWSKVIAKGDPYYNRNYCLDTDLPKINYNKIW